MKRLLQLALPLLALVTTSCGTSYTLKYRKQITDTENFSNRIHYADGSLVPIRFRLVVDADMRYKAYYERLDTKYYFMFSEFTKSVKQIAAFKFSYNYYYGSTKNPSVGREDVEAAFYHLVGFHNEKDEKCYLVYGYNNPQIFFTNETVNKAFVEKCRITTYAQDKEGKEISMKSYPVFPGYELSPKGAKDAEWQTGD